MLSRFTLFPIALALAALLQSLAACSSGGSTPSQTPAPPSSHSSSSGVASGSSSSSTSGSSSGTMEPEPPEAEAPYLPNAFAEAPSARAHYRIETYLPLLDTKPGLTGTWIFTRSWSVEYHRDPETQAQRRTMVGDMRALISIVQVDGRFLALFTGFTGIEAFPVTIVGRSISLRFSDAIFQGEFSEANFAKGVIHPNPDGYLPDLKVDASKAGLIKISSIPSAPGLPEPPPAWGEIVYEELVDTTSQGNLSGTFDIHAFTEARYLWQAWEDGVLDTEDHHYHAEFASITGQVTPDLPVDSFLLAKIVHVNKNVGYLNSQTRTGWGFSVFMENNSSDANAGGASIDKPLVILSDIFKLAVNHTSETEKLIGSFSTNLNLESNP